MARIWKWMLALALSLLVLGLLLAGTGLITGARAARVWEDLGGADGLWAAADALWNELRALIGI